MSVTGTSLNINSGNLLFNNDSKYSCISQSYNIKSNSTYVLNASNNININTSSGNYGVNVNDGELRLTSLGNLSNAIIIEATNTNGGILQTAGLGGIHLTTSNGDIDLLSKGADINIGVSSVGTPAINQTQNINMECFNNYNLNSGDMYFVSSDVISFISQTGDIQFGTSSNGNPIIKFENGNLLINQITSNLDYQLDVAITDSSNNKDGYNGIVVNTKLSNVAADITLQTSNTLGDGTQCILSIGSFGSDNTQAIFNTYMAYQTSNIVIRVDGNSYNSNSLDPNNGKDFIYSDIGRKIYWSQTKRQDTITGLSSTITTVNDASNVTISGTYTGETSRVYLLMIDSLGTPDTFKWSNNGGNTYQQQLIPLTLSPITLEYGISVTFTSTTGFLYNQQFTFQTKITALVTNTTSIPIPEPLQILQPFYSYINTTTPSDIVIKTNNNEKMRITGDGAIGIQQNIPRASIDLNSNYNSINHVNQMITGYQINPSIGYLESGGYIVVWNSNDIAGPVNHFDVIAQRYMADGSRYGNNFQVNVTGQNNQSFPSIAGHKLQASNHYCIAWTSNDNITTLYNIYCQIYHNNLPIRAFDIQIDSSNNNISNARVAGLYNGNYIIVWDKDDGTGKYNCFGCIINDSETGGIVTSFQINPAASYSRKFPFVAGLPSNDTYNPNGFVVGYMTAIDNSVDPQYTIAIRVFNSSGTPISNQIPITSISANTYSNISDGLLSLSEINNNNVNEINGGFIMAFYRSYLADTSLFNVSNIIEGLTSGATATIASINPVLSTRQFTIQNTSNRFLVSEQISISSTVPNIGTIIEKIASITFPTLTTAIITLDIGSKNIEAYRFNSNISSVNDALWIKQVNTSPLYNDLDRSTGNSAIFQYKRPMSYVTVDNEGTALVTWTTDSIPSVYYQLLDVDTGNKIGTQQKLTTEYDGLKQRNQVATHLQSIGGNDYGFVISWDNQSLDLQDTGIFQQLIGYKHSLLNIEDGNSNYIFNHLNQLGIGTNSPEASLHIKTKSAGGGSGISSGSSGDATTATIKLQNTSQYVITNQDLQSIEFVDGSNNVLNKIQSVNSLRYDDLYPQPNNLIGFYKFDDTEGTQVIDYSTFTTNRSNITSYVNTNGILNNFNIETCWVPGLINNSLLFNGQNNYVFIENTSANALNTVLETGGQKLSLSLWINIPSNIINGSSYDIISNGGDFTIAGTYLLNVSDIGSNGSMFLTSNIITHDPSNVAIIFNIGLQGSTLLNDAQWHHIVETVSISNSNCSITMYVDGVLENTVTTPGDITAIQHGSFKTYFGSRNGNSNYFRGNMDELRFYNSLLTASEITQLYTYGNPNLPSKASLFLSPNDNVTHNQAIVIDDDGKINNLSSRPLPYSILSGDLTAYQNSVTITGTQTQFINEITIGDIIVLDNQDYTVISIISNTNLTLDRSGYNGVEASITYQSILRRPSIYSFFDNSDALRGNIDNYGNMIIGASKPSTMLEISGASGNPKLIPEITMTNTTIENTLYGRKTALNFRGYDAINATISLTPFVNLGHIETSHYETGTDNKASMRFFINEGTGTTETNIMSLTTEGVGFGVVNSPLTLLNARTILDTEECSFLFQSSYKVDSNTAGVFDERSNIYFGGGSSINDNTGDLKKRVLSGINGSKNTSLDKPIGRLDFATNNDNETYGLENRLSILNTGNVGIDIINPGNVFSVSPEYRFFTGLKSFIDATSVNGTLITLNNQLFTGLTLEQKKMFFGGSLIVENEETTRTTIVSVDLTVGINDTLTVNSNLSTYVGKNVTIHYAGLNVEKISGFTGINTTTPGSVLSVSGSLSLPIHSTTSNITLDSTNYTVVCNTLSNNITITLPVNVNSMRGRLYRLKKIGSNTLSINPNGSNIDGSGATYTVTTTFILLQSDGGDWWIVG